jgi:O-antigen/teichoic acid export membrane protein
MRMNISWAFAGNAGYAACQWAVFILLVRSLTLDDVGQFAFWVAVTGPLFVLANVRLRNLVATDVASVHPFSDYLRARLLTTSLAVTLALGFGMALSAGTGSIAILALLVSARACDAVSDICHGLFQRELDMRSAAIGLLTNGLLSVVFVGSVLALAPSLAGATAAYAAGSFVTLALWDLPRMRQLTRSTERIVTIAGGSLRAAWGLLCRAWPLGLSSAVGSLQTNLPRYIVAAYLGHAALAVFTALAYIPTLGNLIVNAVAQASLPVLARDLRVSSGQYRRRLRGLLQAGVSLAAVSTLATAVMGHAVLTLVYGPEIATRFDVLLWLMIAAAVAYSFVFLGTAATARLRFGSQLLISSVALLTVAVSIVPLVSRYDLVGAGYALCLGALVEGGAYVGLTVWDFRSNPGLQPMVPGMAGGR